ncbi:MAG: hypothetical protein R2764_09330 [Bacteroidales bacterium]
MKDAEMYAGCVAGAIQKVDYLEIIQKAAIKNIEIRKEKRNHPSLMKYSRTIYHKKVFEGI